MPTNRDSIDAKRLNDLRDSVTEETVKYMVSKLTEILEKLQDKSYITDTSCLKHQYEELEKVTKKLGSIVGCSETIESIIFDVDPNYL